MSTAATRQKWYSQQYLRTDHWQGIRTAKLCEKGFACEKCGRKARLQVHHKAYAPYREKLSDLVVLCEDCHLREHDAIDKERFHKADAMPPFVLRERLMEKALEMKVIMKEAKRAGLRDPNSILKSVFAATFHK